MRHDLRKTLLTMAGMAWGIATVVLLLAYGNGFGRAIENIFESFGATAVGVFPGRTSQEAGGNKAGVPVRFTGDDIELLRNNVPLCKHVVRMSQKDSVVQNGNRSFTFPVMGLDPEIEEIWNLDVDEGRFLDDADNMGHGLRAVIGSEARDRLFSGMQAVGDEIRVDGVEFQVVGVLKARMQESDDDDNRVIYVPYNSMDVLKDTHYLDGIWLDSQGLDHNKLDQTIRGTLAAAHNFKEDDKRAVFVFDAQKQLQQFGIISLALKVLLGFIGTVTLGIGGVGLMNIMLVSVTQRTREIGIRMALGAQPERLIAMFVRQGLRLTLIGAGCGLVTAFLTMRLMSSLLFHVSPVDPVTYLSITIAVIAVAYLACYLPSRRAATVEPMHALRNE